MDGGIPSACRYKDGTLVVLDNKAMPTVLQTNLLFPTGEFPYVFAVSVAKGDRTPVTFQLPVTLTELAIPDVAVTSGRSFKACTCCTRIHAQTPTHTRGMRSLMRVYS